ncbi:hypothetical protein ACIP9H_33605 [Streptomyces sp. NPDC088732]|uniref:hypothetical protein n=1 Tax=Streptomyces sp. NPDC088732 TaxID=3365879 RepID=UPI0038005B34
MSQTFCTWWEDEHGGRYLVPGCMARVDNPDIDECSCPSVETQLTKAQGRIAELERELRGLRSWHDCIVRAVHDHSDGKRIMKTAAGLRPTMQPNTAETTGV